MNISLGTLITICMLVASIAGTSAVTVYKVHHLSNRIDNVEKDLTAVKGYTQLLLGLYIRNNGGQLPDVPWEFPSHP